MILNKMYIHFKEMGTELKITSFFLSFLCLLFHKHKETIGKFYF
jgi:hypothetical protein